MTTDQPSRRATRSDGILSRETILNAAARLATVEGLEGMSIGRLAAHIGMSKSGIYAHFGSKEELQLATVETAARIFEADVLRPADDVLDPLAQIQTLCDGFLSHLERDVFPGGCFFISALNEFDTRPGPVLDKVTETAESLVLRFGELLTRAKAGGTVRADEDVEQLSWELDAFLLMGNVGWVLTKDAQPLNRARAAFNARLDAARAGVTPPKRR